MADDYYKIIGIVITANNDTIKKAYIKLVKQWHPDKNKSSGAEEEFKKISKEYNILIDTDSRKKSMIQDISLKINNQINNQMNNIMKKN